MKPQTPEEKPFLTEEDKIKCMNDFFSVLDIGPKSYSSVELRAFNNAVDVVVEKANARMNGMLNQIADAHIMVSELESEIKKLREERDVDMIKFARYLERLHFAGRPNLELSYEELLEQFKQQQK